MVPVILIIDDDVAVCESAVLTLEMSGQQAGFCVDFQSAGNLLPQAGLVFLDITMPGVSGIRALEEIRRDYPCLPVVMFTGVADLNTAVGCMQMGAVDYLVKPVEPEILLATALEHLPDKKENFPCVRLSDQKEVNNFLKEYTPERIRTNVHQEALHLANWLAGRFSDPDCSLQNASQELGINTTYLSRMVAGQWNMPFRQLVNSLRLASFLRLALEDEQSEVPLDALAEKVGWTNRSTFFGAVKYLTAMTPAELRQLITKKQE